MTLLKAFILIGAMDSIIWSMDDSIHNPWGYIWAFLGGVLIYTYVALDELR